MACLLQFHFLESFSFVHWSTYWFCTGLQFGAWCSPLVQNCAPNHKYQNYSSGTSRYYVNPPSQHPVWIAYHLGSQDHIFGILTRQQGRQGRDRILVGARGFSVFRNPDWLWEPSDLLFSGCWGALYQGVKWPEHEADHSHVLQRSRVSGAVTVLFVLMFVACVEKNFTFCTQHDYSPVWHASHIRLGGVPDCTLNTPYCKWSDIKMLWWTEKATHVKKCNTISNFESLILSKLMSWLANLLSFSCSNWLLAHC